MNIFIGLLLTAAGASISHPPAPSNYIVTYKQEIYRAKDGVVPKVAVPEDWRAVMGKDSIEVLKFPFSLSIELRVKSNGDYRMVTWSDVPGINISNNDTLIRENGKYFTRRNPTRENASRIQLKKQTGTKTVLGYKCERFMATDPDTKDVYEVWATKELPETITGFYRFPQFGYAIMEMRDLGGFWKLTATMVMKVDNEKDVFSYQPFAGVGD